MNTVTLPNGETIAYRKREGGDQILLLIHGNMTTSKHWDLVMEAFPSEYTIYAPDLRGFGSSSYHHAVETVQDFSHDIYLFIKELGLSSVSICGWSAGGPIVMQVAVDYPEYVEKVILLGSASTRGYPFYSVDGEGNKVRLVTKEEVAKDPSKALPVLAAYQNKDKRFLKKLWELLIYTENKPDEKRYNDYLEEMCKQRSLVDVYQALNLFNISAHDNGLGMGTNQAKDIQAPVLVLWGDRDLVVPERMTLEIVEDIGEKASFVFLTDCGHSPLEDDLEQLITRMTEFLEKK